jgi:hypothetical protein
MLQLVKCPQQICFCTSLLVQWQTLLSHNYVVRNNAEGRIPAEKVQSHGTLCTSFCRRFPPAFKKYETASVRDGMDLSSCTAASGSGTSAFNLRSTLETASVRDGIESLFLYSRFWLGNFDSFLCFILVQIQRQKIPLWWRRYNLGALCAVWKR